MGEAMEKAARMKRRVKGFFVVWLRVWGSTAHFGGHHYLRRAHWTFKHWNRMGRGRDFVR